MANTVNSFVFWKRVSFFKKYYFMVMDEKRKACVAIILAFSIPSKQIMNRKR